jgi:uncharacterized membrane protein
MHHVASLPRGTGILAVVILMFVGLAVVVPVLTHSTWASLPQGRGTGRKRVRRHGTG